jgi:hypothetical protein
MSYGYATSSGNGFDRTNYNEAKLGAYYTDVAHCESLSGLFSFPEGEEVCVLEPSIGNGAAVMAVTDKAENPDVKIFGVELNTEVAKETAQEKWIEEVVEADFTNGVIISNNVFSFCFGNPPYMDDCEAEGGKRLEKTFLEKVTQNYLKKDGVLVWVIPYSVISDVTYIRYLMRNYERLCLYRFRESEYKKWRQVVFVGRKKSPKTPTPEELQGEFKSYYSSEETIPVLPDSFEGTPFYRSIAVEPSDSGAIKKFASQEFDAAAAYELLRSYDLSDYRKIVSRRLTQKPFASKAAGRPPIPPKNDIQYLRAVSGEGQGFAGEEGVDLHLQRGVAEVVEDISYKKGEDGSEVMVSTTHTEITMSLIETSGRITTLQ